MTLDQVYSVLENSIFYEKQSLRKFSFADNSIHIDRRALIPFSIYKENEDFFLVPDVPITNEKELRIEMEEPSSGLIYFYGKTTGEKLLTLEA